MLLLLLLFENKKKKKKKAWHSWTNDNKKLESPILLVKNIPTTSHDQSNRVRAAPLAYPHATAKVCVCALSTFFDDNFGECSLPFIYFF